MRPAKGEYWVNERNESYEHKQQARNELASPPLSTAAFLLRAVAQAKFDPSPPQEWLLNAFEVLVEKGGVYADARVRSFKSVLEGPGRTWLEPAEKCQVQGLERLGQDLEAS